MVERKQGRHDIDLVFAGDSQKAVDIAPESRRASRYHSVCVNIDSDVAAAREPDPSRIDAILVQFLKVLVPPRGIVMAAEVVPCIPGRVGAIEPDSFETQLTMPKRPTATDTHNMLLRTNFERIIYR